MILTSKFAKDLEKLILKTDFDPLDIKHKLDFYKERNRITPEEYAYLIELVDTRTDLIIEQAAKVIK